MSLACSRRLWSEYKRERPYEYTRVSTASIYRRVISIVILSTMSNDRWKGAKSAGKILVPVAQESPSSLGLPIAIEAERPSICTHEPESSGKNFKRSPYSDEMDRNDDEERRHKGCLCVPRLMSRRQRCHASAVEVVDVDDFPVVPMLAAAACAMGHASGFLGGLAAGGIFAFAASRAFFQLDELARELDRTKASHENQEECARMKVVLSKIEEARREKARKLAERKRREKEILKELEKKREMKKKEEEERDKRAAEDREIMEKILKITELLKIEKENRLGSRPVRRG